MQSWTQVGLNWMGVKHPNYTQFTISLTDFNPCYSFTSVKPHRTSAVLIRRVHTNTSSRALAAPHPLWRASVPIRLRLHSTAPPPRTTKPTADTPAPIAPSTLPARKHKVELRPAPVKTLKSSQSPAQGSGATPLKPMKPEQLASTSTTPATSKSSVLSESVVEATRHDYEAASKHGILAPPPDGANRVYKLYHQAKELIVRFRFHFRWFSCDAM